MINKNIKFEVITAKEFDDDYKVYGYEEFTRKVLQRCANKKEHGLVGTITLVDAEPSKRIFLINEDGQEFTVRYFIHDQNENVWKASYTLYANVIDEDGSGHGEMISEGYAVSHYVA